MKSEEKTEEKTENLSVLTDQELLEKKKHHKKKGLLLALVWGIFIGIAIYAATTEGGFITFIPLIVSFIILGILMKEGKHNKAIKAELKSRDLK